MHNVSTMCTMCPRCAQYVQDVHDVQCKMQDTIFRNIHFTVAPCVNILTARYIQFHHYTIIQCNVKIHCRCKQCKNVLTTSIVYGERKFHVDLESHRFLKKDESFMSRCGKKKVYGKHALGSKWIACKLRVRQEQHSYN